MNAAIERIINEHLEKDPNLETGLLAQLKDKWINKAKAEGIAEGIAKGITERNKEIAKKMLAAGIFTSEQISEFSGLSLAEIENLRANFDKKN